MPTLETTDGKAVDVDPPTPAEINARFQQTMNSDGAADPATPPKRAARGPATDTARPRGGKAPRAEKSRTTAAPAAGPLTGAQRKAGVAGLMQLAAVIPLGLAKRTGKDAYKADAIAIVSSADEIAEACAETADADPRFAAALDRVCAAGPYGALITAAFGLGSQLARNHRPALNLPGTVHPDKLLAGNEPAAETPAAA